MSLQRKLADEDYRRRIEQSPTYRDFLTSDRGLTFPLPIPSTSANVSLPTFTVSTANTTGSSSYNASQILSRG